MDTETSGLDETKHEIIEISLMRITHQDIVQKTWCVQPLSIESINNEALIVNQHKLEDLKHETRIGRETYIHPSKVLPEIENWIMEDMSTAESRILVGQNIMFDYRMIESFWAKHSSNNSFPFSKRGMFIDTKILTLAIDAKKQEKREKYSLTNLVNDFGVKKEKAHKADSDTRMTAELFLTILDYIK
jgi:DNA polymerase III epsilon subunit-like protein